MPRDKKTICYKVSRSIEDLNKALETSQLDILYQINRLHQIRKQAQKMEDGLKLRKKLMIEAKIEDKYQSLKAKKSIPPGINKIANEGEEQTKEKTQFEFTIKREGKTIYQNTAYAGVVCVVEEVEEIDQYGQVTGRTQKMMFGNPMMLWFAFDQLKIAVEAKGAEIMQSIKEAVKNKKFVDPNVRKTIIEATNKIKEAKQI